MRLRFSLLFSILIFAVPAEAQLFDNIRTESDWEFLFRDGFYDYNTYQVFRTLFEDSFVSDTSEFLISSLGISSAEVRSGISGPYNETADKRLNPGSPYLPRRVKIRKKLQQGENDSYLIMSHSYERYSVNFKLRETANTWRPESRSIRINRDNWKITFGNFTANAGCGLGIGRFDYRPVSFEANVSETDAFLFPDNSFYNGLKLETDDLTLIYSGKKYGELFKNFLGGCWNINLEKIAIGFTGGATRLEDNSGTRSLGFVSTFVRGFEKNWQAEIAYAETGIGVYGSINKDNNVLKLWHYDSGYINLQSSGYAYPDYVSFADSRFEIAFRQPQAGEIGLFYRRDLKISTFEITTTLETWKKRLDHNIKAEYSLYGDWEMLPDIISEFDYSRRRGWGDDRSLVSQGISIRSNPEISIKNKLWIENNIISKDRSNYYLFTGISLSEGLELRGRLRVAYDSDIDYFIEQRTSISGNLILMATYRWRDEFDRELGPLYISLEKLW